MEVNIVGKIDIFNFIQKVWEIENDAGERDIFFIGLFSKTDCLVNIFTFILVVDYLSRNDKFRAVVTTCEVIDHLSLAYNSHRLSIDGHLILFLVFLLAVTSKKPIGENKKNKKVGEELLGAGHWSCLFIFLLIIILGWLISVEFIFAICRSLFLILGNIYGKIFFAHFLDMCEHYFLELILRCKGPIFFGPDIFLIFVLSERILVSCWEGFYGYLSQQSW